MYLLCLAVIAGALLLSVVNFQGEQAKAGPDQN
ncbi:MAG: hypothetical protein KatS3mg030_433 [Saprospiraceae bacterium]|nr:MAG: hypothetical protein KatS3mg030_433 [Saprospiraceae bacterium]